MNSNDVATPNPVPTVGTVDAPPPPPPPPVTRQRADFAASAAMANDILALGVDDAGTVVTPSAPGPTRPRSVPELDEDTAMALSFNGSPMAPDFFFTSSRSKGSKSKKARWKHSR